MTQKAIRGTIHTLSPEGNWELEDKHGDTLTICNALPEPARQYWEVGDAITLEVEEDADGNLRWVSSGRYASMSETDIPGEVEDSAPGIIKSNPRVDAWQFKRLSDDDWLEVETKLPGDPDHPKPHDWKVDDYITLEGRVVGKLASWYKHPRYRGL